MTSLIRGRAAATAEMLDAFGDERLVAGALAFEAALARAQAAAGVISAEAAERIAEACAAPMDIPALADAAAHAGTFAIPLVAELRRRIGARDPEAAAQAHRGATSQDVADTVLMLQAKAGLALLDRDLSAILRGLERLATTHAGTPMLARTLLQPAAPTTFGLTAAQWRLGVAGAARRLRHEAEAALRLQLGGPVGVLGGLDGRGPEVAARMAQELGLGVAPVPWHARREAVAGLGAALAIVAGALAKIARDVALLAQGEVGEAFEPRVEGRGGSSALAHKRNPTGCQVALSAAVRAPHLAASLISGLPQEHERGLGGWQAEAPALAELFLATQGATAAMAEVVNGLEVDPAAMRRNLEAAGLGLDVADAEALVRRALEAGDV